ncbi:choice-of-anchor I family protein [Prosthecobacter sp. SYSU 5D2]|uniref:choice-of-anchor I family protein n=1 Tax=Prosthecobacter sp. SYSU 5D2 TaxID=3134134 RepID=UPI0031FEF85B
MKIFSKRIRLAALSVALSLGAFASTAKAQLLVTEIQSSQTTGDADYWELTNFGEEPVSLAGYTWDDDSESFANGSAWALPMDSSIEGGESVIFTNVEAAAFRTRWNLTESVKVFTTANSPGLGGNDGIAFFNSAGEKLFFFSYGAGQFTKSNGEPSTGGHAGLSAGGVATDALIWDPTSGTTAETARYTSATGDNFGSFANADETDHGSPGQVDVPPPILLLTELQSNQSGGAPEGAEDYWELTNLGASSVDISGYKWGDSGMPFDDVEIITIPEGTSIAPGESVILTSALAEDFRAWWGLDPSVQVLSNVDAPGFGKDDGVRFYDPSGTEVFAFSYGPAGFKLPNGNDSEGDHAGLSAGGTEASQAAVWDSASGTEDPRYTFATGNTLGTYVAAVGTDLGSPGVSGDGDEGPSITLTLEVSPATFAENEANPAATGTVTRDGSTDGDLVVTLASADTTEALVPATVTILTGQTSATFDVTAVDDSFPDGSQTFNITATAEDASLANFEITVTDDADVVSYKLMLTEIQSNQSGSAPSASNDYWELTNFGESAVSLANFTWHDSGRSSGIAQAWKLAPGSSIAPGESVIFTSVSPAAFRAWWGLEDTVQVFQAPSAPGFGQNDGVSLFESGGNEVFFFSYAAAGFTKADGTPSTGGHAGPSAGGTEASQALIWVPASGTESPRYTAATGTNFGSFQPAIGSDLGSPGITDGISPPLRDASIVTRGPLKLGRVSTFELAGAEISAYDPATKRVFATSDVGLQVIDLSNPAEPVLLTTLTFTEAPISLNSSDVTSVDIHNGVLAVAVPNGDKTLRGHVVFLNAADNAYLGKVEVGYLPDHLTFTPDGSKVLTADEGEYQLNGTDPNPGTVTIIDVTGGFATPVATLVGFEAYDAQAPDLKAAGVRIFEESPGVLRLPSLDFEPEYLAVSPDSTQAMVTLQEANAVAILDITTATFTSVVPLGEKDFSSLLADFSDRDGPGDSQMINLTTGNPVFGLYMPDSIASFSAGGQTFYAIANEGDDRNDFFTETTTVGNAGYVLDPTVFPNAAELKTNARLGRLTVSNAPGLRGDANNDGNVDRILMYGARSFSILNDEGDMIYDSGDDIETTLASIGDPLFDDGRSDNKGPEPEGIEIGVINGRTYAFVGLERHRSIIIYDVTDPANVTQAGLVSFPEDENPEGIHFIPAKNSPNGVPMIIVMNEDSNTMTLFTVEPENFTLQVLHLADGEAGLLASQTAPNLAALVDAFDDEYDNTLILSGGDNFIPSPFLNAGTDPSLSTVPGIGATAFARPDIAIHNMIGVEASAIGNHEWDLGSNVFMDAIGNSGAWIGAQFPHISSNLDYSADSAANARFTNVPLDGTTTAVPEASTVKTRLVPTAVITKGGEKIGLVGVTTQILRAISSPSGTIAKGFPAGTTGVDDMDLLATHVQPYIDELAAEGVTKIILLSHLQQLANERLLATKLTGVDIILAAGSNTRLGDEDDVAVAFPGHSADFADTYPILTAGADSKPTLIINTDNEYTYLGRLTVEFDEAGEIIVSNLADRIALNGAYAATTANVAAAWDTIEDNLAATAFAPGTKGASVKAITDAVQAVINAKDGQIFGYTNVYLEGERSFVRSQETNLGNITADANSDSLRAITGNDIPIVSVKNGGGIRAQIGAVSSQPGSSDKLPPLANPEVGKAAGGISLLDVENALRFNNRLMAFDTTPQGLKAILEHGVAAWPNQGRFPHIAGVAFAWDPNRPVNDRITSMALIDENDEVVTALFKNGLFNFLAPQVIRVVTLNFMAQGGDGYPIKANGSNFRYILTDGTLGPVIADESLNFTAVPQLPDNALGEQKAFTDYINARYPTPQTAYNVADTPASLDFRIQNLNFRLDSLVPVEITADTDGDGIPDLEEIAYGGNPDAGLRVGDVIDYDFSVLKEEGNTFKLIGKLPAGLSFDPATGKLTGQLGGKPGNYALQILEMNGKEIIGSYALDLNVAPFPAVLLGHYEALLETGESTQPKGMVKVFVSGSGKFTATLEYLGAKRRSSKGTFTLTPGGTSAEIDLSFPAAKDLPAVTGQIEVATDSPLVTGTYTSGTETGSQRGFRMTAKNANPPAVQKIVTVLDAGSQNGVDYPAGQGWAKGSVSKTGVIKLKGLLGDAKAVTMSLRLSATAQALVWSQPYKNKQSYIGGILSVGDLGQPTNIPQSLNNGLEWFKGADAKEPSYAAGFAAPLSVEALTSKFVPVKTAAELAASLGLIDSLLTVEIEGAGLSNAAPNDAPVLPTQFTLDSKFKLSASAPASPIPWVGKVGKADGSFSGTLTLPAGKAAATGVLLQDESFGAIVGGGLIKVPVEGSKKTFRTSSILLEQ